jgi:site-specific DNA-methyltransferase (adenine-specific)
MFNLMQGDCLERMKDIPDGSVDMVLTDPPYGTTACKWDSVIPLEPMWEQLKRVIKPSGVIVMTASQPFTTKLISSNYEMFKYCWVWNKKRPSNPMLAKKQCLKIHEDVCVFYKSFGVYNPQGVFETDGKPRGGVKPSNTELGFGKSVKSDYKQTHSGYPKSILEFGTDNTKNVHPTQKPVSLMEYLIKTYTNEGETVLDFTMGSGTTGVACVNTNRNFVGIELDEGYFEIASKRIADAKEKQTI